MDDTHRLIDKALAMGAESDPGIREWGLIESTTGVMLPEDYKYFSENVSGFIFCNLIILDESEWAFGDRTLWFNYYINFEMDRSIHKEYKNSYVFPPYPKNGSAYCFARGFDFAGLGWEVQNGVAQPRIHSVPDYDDPPEAYDMTFTEFMLRVLDGDMPFSGWKWPEDVTPEIKPISLQYRDHPRRVDHNSA